MQKDDKHSNGLVLIDEKSDEKTTEKGNNHYSMSDEHHSPASEAIN